MTKKKLKKRPRKKRVPKREQFASDIVDILQVIERHYRKNTNASEYFATVTVVSSCFVWAIRHGCPVTGLNSVIKESLELAFKGEGIPMADERPIDPKELN